MIFRVWCLTWEDTEAEGTDVFTARPDSPGARKDAICVYYPLNAESAAEEYARHAHNNRDGHECTWPLVFRVKSPDGKLQDLSVSRDYEPVFRASRT